MVEWYVIYPNSRFYAAYVLTFIDHMLSTSLHELVNK